MEAMPPHCFAPSPLRFAQAFLAGVGSAMGVALFHSLAGAACGDSAVPLGVIVLLAALSLAVTGYAFCCGCLVGGGGVWLAGPPRGRDEGSPPKGWEWRLGGYRLE